MEVNSRSLTSYIIDIDANPKLFEDFAVTEISLSESLLSPSLHVKVKVSSYRHNGYVKNWDLLSGAKLKISATRPILAEYNYNPKLDIETTIYRIEDRVPRSYQNEDFVICAIDETALTNASKRISKSWKCTPPHSIAADALLNCVGVPNLVVEQSIPNRTYFAEDIHPYQVVAQQADVALAGTNDPSFLHYMTFENIVGTHRFESLYGMSRKEIVWNYYYNEKGDVEYTWENPFALLSYSNPCDFDLLSDLLNGVDPKTGLNNKSLIAVNPMNGMLDLVNGNLGGCGIGSITNDISFTNKYSAGDEGNCEIDVEHHKLYRVARLQLLEPDKVAFKATVAFNPNLHVGQMIYLEVPNKVQNPDGTITTQPDFGSGYYLISNLTHSIRPGGYSLTMLDCISKSVGNGGSTQ